MFLNKHLLERDESRRPLFRYVTISTNLHLSQVAINFVPKTWSYLETNFKLSMNGGLMVSDSTLIMQPQTSEF